MSRDVVERRVEPSLPRRDPESVAADLADDALVLLSGFGRAGYPKAVPLALAESGRDLSLTVISGGSVGDEVDTELVKADAIARRFPYQATDVARAAVNDGRMAFHDRHIATLGDEVAFGHYGIPDVCIVEAVAVGADWLIPTTSLGHTSTYVASAERLVVEVNRAQPLSLQRLHDVFDRGTPPDRPPIPLATPGERIGSPRISFDPAKLLGVVETDRPDAPYTFREPSATDRAIAENLTDFLTREVESTPVFDEALTLQFGVGSLGNALMGAFADADFGARTVSYYGEVIQDGLLDMLDADAVDATSATSLALSTAGQERLFADIDRYADRVVLRNADVSNNPTLVDRFGVVSVNSALEVDVFGHVNSTHLSGTHVVNGIGGSGDFTRASTLSVIALASTAKDGAIPRIVPMVPHVDHTEHDVAVVVTEQGVADLRGCSPRERAERLVHDCAHPDYRPELEAYLERAALGGGNVPHDLETVYDWYLDR